MAFHFSRVTSSMSESGELAFENSIAEDEVRLAIPRPVSSPSSSVIVESSPPGASDSSSSSSSSSSSPSSPGGVGVAGTAIGFAAGPPAGLIAWLTCPFRPADPMPVSSSSASIAPAMRRARTTRAPPRIPDAAPALCSLMRTPILSSPSSIVLVTTSPSRECALASTLLASRPGVLANQWSFHPLITEDLTPLLLAVDPQTRCVVGAEDDVGHAATQVLHRLGTRSLARDLLHQLRGHRLLELILVLLRRGRRRRPQHRPVRSTVLAEVRLLQHLLHVAVQIRHATSAIEEPIELLADVPADRVTDLLDPVDDERVAVAQLGDGEAEDVDQLSHRDPTATLKQVGEVVDHTRGRGHPVHRVLGRDVEEVAVLLAEVLERIPHGHHAFGGLLHLHTRAAGVGAVLRLQVRHEVTQPRHLRVRDADQAQLVRVVLRIVTPHICIHVELLEDL